MTNSKTTYRTRLAPSPTGHLHLGHVLHICSVEDMARRFNADIGLRMEDHDRSRCRPEFEASIIRDLTWLGVKVPTNPWRQSERHMVYQNILERLMSKGLVYACACSRKDIQSEISQSAGELRYPGTCRDKNIPLDQPETSLRIKIPDAPWSFDDLLQGRQTQNPATQCGDVMIRDRLGQWTYQFAVVIDDLDQNINLIIRGLDLLSSTARQLALRALIDPTAPIPAFAHHPLLKEPTGQKLSKRERSESIAKLRDNGMTPTQVRDLARSLVAKYSGDPTRPG